MGDFLQNCMIFSGYVAAFSKSEAGVPLFDTRIWRKSQMESPLQMGTSGKVVLCSARDCSYNENTKCVAEAVHVMFHRDHADCNTYTHNRHTSTDDEWEEQEDRY
jgi:hypothetical protein